MTEADKVAICIPNWNHAKFLPRSVGSAVAACRALAKAGVEAQVIVADDDSRDGSQKLLFSFAVQNPGLVDVIFAPSNQGLATTRNQLLAHSTARYICFLDADNELLPQNLPLFYRAIKETGAAVIYGNLIMHDGQRSVGFASNDFLHGEFYEDNYVDAFALYDSEALKAAGGYRKSMTSHEDWEMYLHLIAEGNQLVFVPITMGYYFVNENSMLANHNFEHKDMHRIYNQRNTTFPVGFDARRVMYHPEIGWLMRD